MLGAFGITFLLFNDPRARFDPPERRRSSLLPTPGSPALWRQALAATLPSTFGVTVLALIALVPRPTLAALLAGVCAGLGVARRSRSRASSPTLYVDPQSRLVYRR